jgi:carboxyl-terminal processing protease
MRLLTVAWVLLSGAALARALLSARSPRIALRLLPFGALALMAAQGLVSLRASPLALLFALPGYLATVTHALLAAVFWRWAPPRRVGPVLAALGLALLGFSAHRLVQFDLRRAPVAGFREALLREPRSTDLGQKTWSEAFEALVSKLEVEYPFTEWKGIDWPSLRAEIGPEIARAQAAEDRRGYYRALRGLARRLPDGHVDLAGDDFGLRRDEVGGEFGLSLAALDDGRVIVDRLEPEGSAARQGVSAGDEVTSWNGTPIVEAVSGVSTLWAEEAPAAAEGRRLQQLLLLTRAPIGARATLTLVGAASGERRVELQAEDRPERRPRANVLKEVLFGCPVEWRTLASGAGYVRIRYELPTLRCIAPEEELARALAAFERGKAHGLILDLRDNFGGEDALVPRFAAFFLGSETLYERPSLFDPRTKDFAPVPGIELRVKPRGPHYERRVVLLIGARTLSSGEGLPLLLKGAPNVTLLGFDGTHGSFAINQKEVELPEGLTFVFPQARSVDASGRIQVDSDATGTGGVAPDLRVPRDGATLEALRSGRDVLLERAVALLAGGA